MQVSSAYVDQIPAGARPPVVVRAPAAEPPAVVKASTLFVQVASLSNARDAEAEAQRLRRRMGDRAPKAWRTLAASVRGHARVRLYGGPFDAGSAAAFCRAAWRGEAPCLTLDMAGDAAPSKPAKP